RQSAGADVCARVAAGASSPGNSHPPLQRYAFLMTAALETLTIVSPGLHTLVVDQGRPRTRSLGVPVGGAADRRALALGNALVGNDVDAAGLEINLVGPALRSSGHIAVV